jgi:hypothetical protein
MTFRVQSLGASQLVGKAPRREFAWSALSQGPASRRTAISESVLSDFNGLRRPVNRCSFSHNFKGLSCKRQAQQARIATLSQHLFHAAAPAEALDQSLPLEAGALRDAVPAPPASEYHPRISRLAAVRRAFTNGFLEIAKRPLKARSMSTSRLLRANGGRPLRKGERVKSDPLRPFAVVRLLFEVLSRK